MGSMSEDTQMNEYGGNLVQPSRIKGQANRNLQMVPLGLGFGKVFSVCLGLVQGAC